MSGGAKRATPRSEPTSFIGEGRDLDVLASIAWAGVLSTSQVERLHFPSRRRAQRRLRALFDHGLVRTHLQGEALQRENVFTASELGIERLVEGGLFADGAPRAMRVPRVQHLPHALAVREVFVAVVLAERTARVRVGSFLFEGELRTEPVLAAAGLHPDALVALARDGVDALVGVEVDLGTETTTTLRAKFDTWRRVLSTSGARRPFESATLLVAAPRESRCATLRRLLGEAGLAERSVVVMLEGVAALFASGWPFAPAAPPGRARAPHSPAAEAASFTALPCADEGFTPLSHRRGN